MMNWRKWTMIAAAAFNLVIGVAGMFVPGASSDALIVALLVACFGIVYAVVASDVSRFRQVLWAGVAGKLGVVGLLGPQVIAGTQPASLGAVLVGDALFALLFLVILLGRETE